MTLTLGSRREGDDGMESCEIIEEEVAPDKEGLGFSIVTGKVGEGGSRASAVLSGSSNWGISGTASLFLQKECSIMLSACFYPASRFPLSSS